MGFLTAGHASSDNGAADVSGLAYAQAVKVLKSQGYKAVFGGSVGSDVRKRGASSKARSSCRTRGSR